MDKENKTIATRESFWSLLKKCEIEIPRMQRNYAQGREEVDINQKRENLIDDLFTALEEQKRIDLNFVYGNVYNNKLIPIDGQQRLTTLFLLYWYFMQLSNKRDIENKKKLLRFTYETRDVTGKFCNKLVNDVIINFNDIKNNNIADIIKDYYWFFRDFANDSSVKSMLVMLQSIHLKACNIGMKKCQKYWELLISEECPITFLFLNIDDIGLTEEIYIKMNARGKPLTAFENFKAQLARYLESKNEKEFSDELLSKFNKEWSNFFWTIQYGSDDTIVFDERIMNFIKFFIFNDYICNNQSPNATIQKLNRETLKKLRNESIFEFTNRIFKDEFRNVYAFKNQNAVINEDTFKRLYKLINALSQNYFQNNNLIFLNKSLYQKEYFDEDKFFYNLIENNNFTKLSMEELTILYAEYAFIIKYSDNNGNFKMNNELTEWIRVIYNLAKGSSYNQLDDYYRSIKTINFFVENNYAIDIISYISNIAKESLKKGRFGFHDLQIKEETIKANLLKTNSQWKELITEAENTYLDNQIICILNFSGIEDYYDNKLNINNNLQVDSINNIDKLMEKFKIYLQKFKIFFEQSGLKEKFEENSIFRRALLTFGGEDAYLLKREGTAYSFLNNNDRDYSFKRLLRDDNNGKRAYMKELFDNISSSDKAISELEGIIENYCKVNKSSWKYYFVSMPEILNSLKSGKNTNENDIIFFDNGRFINMKSNNEILLCTKKSTRSTNREYYSYVLYLKAKKLNYNVFYNTDYRESSKKYVLYKNKNDDEINIWYAFDENDNCYKFEIIKNGDVLDSNTDIEYILNYIKNDIQ